MAGELPRGGQPKSPHQQVQYSSEISLGKKMMQWKEDYLKVIVST